MSIAIATNGLQARTMANRSRSLPISRIEYAWPGDTVYTQNGTLFRVVDCPTDDSFEYAGMNLIHIGDCGDPPNETE